MKDFEKLEPVIFRSLRSILQTPENEIENLEVVSFKFYKFKINKNSILVFHISRGNDGIGQKWKEYQSHKGKLQAIRTGKNYTKTF